VEEALTHAYEEFLGEPVQVDGSGRTDTGVHARHQVAVLRTARELPPQAIRYGVLPYLPEGLSIFHVEQKPGDWRPRPAVSRQYRYFLWKSAPIPLFYEPFAAVIDRPLNLDRMIDAAERIPGERDFSAFRAAGCTAKHPIRRIDRVVVVNRGGHWEFRVTGNAFLRQMVRILVGTLVDTGLGRTSPEQVADILESCDRSKAGPTMPAKGLFLWRITLPQDREAKIPPTCWEVPIC
jgi:tRNA pseudouridine38-40 synthase